MYVKMITYDKFKQLRDFSKNCIIPGFESAGLNSRARKLKSCGEFTITKKCNECNTYYFDGWYSCKDRFCPLCQKKKSLQYVARLMPILIKLANDGYYIQLLNFTIKDSGNLKFGIRTLTNAFRYMTHQNRLYAKEFNKRFIGGVRGLEIKKGANSGDWHPHYHCIVVKNEYSNDFEYLKNAWNNSVKSVTGLLDIDVKLGSVFIQGINANNRKELLKGVVESLKYMTKYDGEFNTKKSHTLALNSLDKCSILELVEATENVRQLSTWGVLRNFNAKEENSGQEDLHDLVERVCLVCNSKIFSKEYLNTDTNDKIVADFCPNMLVDKLKESYDIKQQKVINQKKFEDFKTIEQICFDDLDLDSDIKNDTKCFSIKK